MKKSIWLSYDLGVKGDYESLYTWLANKKAIECGDTLAYFTINAEEEDVVARLKRSLEKSITLNKRDRIYIIWKGKSKVKGKFLFGSRKAPPWEGYGHTYKSTPEEST